MITAFSFTCRNGVTLRSDQDEKRHWNGIFETLFIKQPTLRDHTGACFDCVCLLLCMAACLTLLTLFGVPLTQIFSRAPQASWFGPVVPPPQQAGVMGFGIMSKVFPSSDPPTQHHLSSENPETFIPSNSAVSKEFGVGTKRPPPGLQISTLQISTLPQLYPRLILCPILCPRECPEYLLPCACTLVLGTPVFVLLLLPSFLHPPHPTHDHWLTTSIMACVSESNNCPSVSALQAASQRRPSVKRV